METAANVPAGKSLTTIAFERLRSDIVSGNLRPGERLRIQALSDSYGIGATAIREALSRLVTDGFVESEDQRGFCVAPVSRDELIDLTETRIAVEVLALEQAMERGGIDWESNLLSAFHRLSRTPLPLTSELHVPWAAVHQQFHDALVAGCGSPWKLRLCKLLYDKSERYRNLAELYTAQRKRDPGAEHQQLMDAAMIRDRELVKELITQDYWTTTNIVLKAAFDGRAALSSGKR